MHRRDHPVSGYRYDVGIGVQLARLTGEAVGILMDNEFYPCVPMLNVESPATTTPSMTNE
jgi:hypothetical protein